MIVSHVYVYTCITPISDVTETASIHRSEISCTMLEIAACLLLPSYKTKPISLDKGNVIRPTKYHMPSSRLSQPGTAVGAAVSHMHVSLQIVFY